MCFPITFTKNFTDQPWHCQWLYLWSPYCLSACAKTDCCTGIKKLYYWYEITINLVYLYKISYPGLKVSWIIIRARCYHIVLYFIVTQSLLKWKSWLQKSGISLWTCLFHDTDHVGLCCEKRWNTTGAVSFLIDIQCQFNQFCRTCKYWHQRKWCPS